MSTTTQTTAGGVLGAPGGRGKRTGADRLADLVSLVVLLGLGGFAIAVSFAHTEAFVRAHGQHQGWIVVGTALTVVGLSVQAGMEVYRDGRAGRGRGWPAVLLSVGVVVELVANASTVHGGGVVARVVAAWPVPVAAAALGLWTRRLQHAAEAAERVPAPAPEPEPLRYVREEEHDQDEELPAPEQLRPLVVAGHDGMSKRDRILAFLDQSDHVPGPTDMGELVGCSKQYAATVIDEWRARPQNHPGQKTLMEVG